MPPRTSEPGRRRGVACLGCLLWLVLCGAAIYVGVQVGRPYFQAWRFEEAMRTQAESAEVNSDADIRRSLMATAADLGVPLAPADLRIQRDRGHIDISARWVRQVVLPKYERTLHFAPSVSAPLDSQTP